ncbi:helix-turn-helix domain-containing protein [Phocaeicola sp.]
MQLIFARLHKYLMENRRFTRRGLNKNTLAVAVRTNEKYLTRAVRCFTDGKTLGQFIESLRMEYAKLLLQRHPDYTIEAIARECGTTSRSSFYRLFRKYYGCAPCEYRERMSG